MKCSFFYEDYILLVVLAGFLAGAGLASVEYVESRNSQKKFHDTTCVVQNMTWTDGSTYVNYTIKVDQITTTTIKSQLYHIGSSFRCWFNRQTKEILMKGFHDEIMAAQVGIILCSIATFIGLFILIWFKYKYQKQRNGSLEAHYLLTETV